MLQKKCDPRINLQEKLFIDNTKIKQFRECNYLGIFLDQNQTFQTQVKSILQKMALGIKTIDPIRKQLPTKSLYTLFQSTVLSHLDYSALFLPGVNNSLIVSLEKQLNCGLKPAFFRILL